MTETKKNSGTTQTGCKGKILAGYLIFSILLIVFDQWTKHLAVAKLRGKEAFVLIDGVFELSYLENRGMAWGLLSGSRWLFLAGTLVVLVLIVYAFLKAPATRRYTFLRFVLALVAAGAVGNMIDRMFNGYVVDFFSFILISFPIFNVADCYVVVGGILFILVFLFYYKEEELSVLLPGRREKQTHKGEEL